MHHDAKPKTQVVLTTGSKVDIVSVTSGYERKEAVKTTTHGILKPGRRRSVSCAAGVSRPSKCWVEVVAIVIDGRKIQGPLEGSLCLCKKPR